MADRTNEQLLDDLIIAATAEYPGRNELRDARSAALSRMATKNEFHRNCCAFCKTPLNQPGRVWTEDCGGDCLACMASIGGDPDAQAALLEPDVFSSGWRVIRDTEHPE